ncbi:sensor histidine kinase [Methanoregula sp. UBA64]|jgi:PAS domain S-box-containing protein|uniref:sensor histidine kinase n=1 Tax=Methanoregula sp. UBA64 TaxID=1915554 RepID=UPI0025F69BDD|nr:PAS domain-containing sensor histidine kinase [Methanoregula sp. UBA64]
MSETNDSGALVRDLVLIFFAMLTVMFLFEMAKQALYPQATLWQSHTLTILFTGLLAVFVMYFPLRARQLSEEKLRRSEIQYRSFVESVEDSIYTVDCSCRYLLVNRRRAPCPGSGQVAELGKRYRDFHSPEETRVFEAQVQRVVKSMSVVQREFEKDGRYFLRKFNPVIDPATNEVIAITVISSDITEQKRTEHALALANKKLCLLSGITRHDIKNQLLVLSGYLEISRESLPDTDRTGSFIAKEQKIVDTIAQQISFTRDYEELGANAPVWQNVGALMSQAAARLPVRDVTVDGGYPSLEIFADPLLGTVFYNLIDNALRYGGPGMTAIRVVSQKTDGGLVLVFEDNGAGISADDRERIFDRGFGKSTGLGLFLVREILSLTGIGITENGTPGTGGRFEMTVPEGGYRFVPAPD